MRTFFIIVRKDGDRFCVWESNIPGLFLETGNWDDMKDAIEDIAPELIISNANFKDEDRDNTEIRVCIENGDDVNAINHPGRLVEQSSEQYVMVV